MPVELEHGRRTFPYDQIFTCKHPATMSRMEAMLDSLPDTIVTESNPACHKYQGNA